MLMLLVKYLVTSWKDICHVKITQDRLDLQSNAIALPCFMALSSAQNRFCLDFSWYAGGDGHFILSVTLGATYIPDIIDFLEDGKIYWERLLLLCDLYSDKYGTLFLPERGRLKKRIFFWNALVSV